MALDLDCRTTEYYVGDGRQKDFTFAFELIEEDDLHVGIFNEDTNEYDEVTTWSRPDGTSIVRFNVAPGAGKRIIIYRLTDIDPIKAVFHPGHPVKAGDLNDNFEQLAFAIEETRCFVEGQNDALSGRFWDKTDETVYSTDTWIEDDRHVATTAAIDAEIDEKLTDIINNIDIGSGIIGDIQDELEDINQEIDNIKDDIADIKDDITDLENNKVDKSSGITTEEQLTGQWVSDDEHFAYTGALSERYDVIFLAEGETTPQEDDTVTHIQPGKLLITSDNNLYAWNGDTWFQPIAGGGGGGGGQHTQIRTTNPITQSYNSSTSTYSLNFDISSLEPAPSTVRTRRTN